MAALRLAIPRRAGLVPTEALMGSGSVHFVRVGLLLVFNGQILDRRFNAVQIAYLGNGLLGFAALPGFAFLGLGHWTASTNFLRHDPSQVRFS